MSETTARNLPTRNPYNFANPVQARSRLVGRDKELRDIEYYLDQAKGNPFPTNLALIGARASGKTSLLNVIEREAKARGMCPVRVNLNEDDARSTLTFVYKLFDGIFRTLLEYPTGDDPDEVCFGGATGRTAETYDDMVLTFEVPDVRTFCPFSFPMHFAKAMSKGRSDAPVSDQALERDLRKLQEEVRETIVILIDECNVLSRERALLQMLRNTFMNLPGYMLIFSGTPDLFPVMDDVFSPIVRQFKKVGVEPFISVKDTEECLLRPLRESGVLDIVLGEDHPYRIRRTVEEIHELTNGRAHEIQLIGHVIFRQMQHGKTARFALTLEALDDLLNTLEVGGRPDEGSLISEIRRLGPEDLHRLAALCTFGTRGTFGQLKLWTHVLSALPDRPSYSPGELEDALATMGDRGLVRIEGDYVSFAGDDRDSVYARYWARHNRVGFTSGAETPSRFVERQLWMWATREDLVPAGGPLSVRRLPIRGPRLDPKLVPLLASDPEKSGLLAQDSPVADSVYDLMCTVHDSGDSKFDLVWLELDGGGASASTIFMHGRNRNAGASTERVAEVLDALCGAARSQGVEAAWGTESVEVWTPQEMSRILLTHEDDTTRVRLASRQIGNMVSGYGEDPVKVSLRYVLRALGLTENLSSDDMNNAGYVLLLHGADLNAAERVLARAAASAPPDERLPRYNLAIVKALQGRLEEAAVDVQGLIEETGDNDQPFALIVPQLMNGRIVLAENSDRPKMLPVFRGALATLRAAN